MACPIQVTTVERRLCGSGTTWRCLGLLSHPPGSTHRSVNATWKLWFCSFCTSNIYCMSVCPGRGILPLWLFLRFLPSFLPCFSIKFVLTRIEGPKPECSSIVQWISWRKSNPHNLIQMWESFFTLHSMTEGFNIPTHKSDLATTQPIQAVFRFG